MGRVGVVLLDGVIAGELKETEEGFSFIYDQNYLTFGAPIGFHFPLRKEPFFAPKLFPFFENLLAEGWLKKLQSRSQKIDERDHFGFLLQNGEDLIGAISVREK